MNIDHLDNLDKLDCVKEEAWGHGWVFGKYTVQTKLSDELVKLLDNSNAMMIAYIEEYVVGVRAGMADTHRGD